jgi:site-specific recombinase XerD
MSAVLHWIRRYIEFHEHQHPRQLAEGNVNRFLTHLAVKEHVAASTQNQALSAVLFLYEHALEQPLDRIEGVVQARRPKRLPVALTVDEVSRVMAHLTGDKWLIAMLLYTMIYTHVLNRGGRAVRSPANRLVPDPTGALSGNNLSRSDNRRNRGSG